MIILNSMISALICLALAADLVMLANLERDSGYRVTGIVCSVFLAVAYLANLFAMQTQIYIDVAPSELVVNCAVGMYQARRTWFLTGVTTGHEKRLPVRLRKKAHG